MLHAYSKLNAATVPAHTPIARKNIYQSNIEGCAVYNALDLVDYYNQVLIRESVFLSQRLVSQAIYIRMAGRALGDV